MMQLMRDLGLTNVSTSGQHSARGDCPDREVGLEICRKLMARGYSVSMHGKTAPVHIFVTPFLHATT